MYMGAREIARIKKRDAEDAAEARALKCLKLAANKL
jgi:hypothetical protein